MNYTPTTWKTGDLISSIRLNKIENGIAALYPQTQIVAPEQTVTITAETDEMTGEPITLAEGVDVSTFSEADFLGLRVSINGKAATLDDEGWMIDVDGSGVFVYPTRDLTDAITGFSLKARNPDTQAVLPGDYTVEIKQVVTKFPTLKAFPVVPGDTSSVLWVIDAPAEDVDAAMAGNGCALLYGGLLGNFAFGCLVRNVMFGASRGSTGSEKTLNWWSSGVVQNDGKYVVLGIA